jgi:pimeloyl-ACP methyl ester carboxylesterase
VTSFSSYDGTTLSYSLVGQGPHLVCLPGGPGRAVAYLEDLAGLSELRTLVLLDPRATGHSEVPADPTTLRFDRLALDVEALRTELGLEQLDVLAHSAGCLVTQAWASQFPGRVRSAVLVTPSDALQGGDRSDVPALRAGFAGEPWYDEAAAAAAELDDAPPSQRAGIERMLRPFFYGRWDERTQAHAATADTQVSKRALMGFAPDGLDAAALVGGLQAVDAPVLVVGGERDTLTGIASVARVAAAFPNATTAVVTGAGHFPWVDEPAGFRAAVDPFVIV